ncbi:MAG: glycosyltransferase [Candidatus Babeliaceae bacterium]
MDMKGAFFSSLFFYLLFSQDLIKAEEPVQAEIFIEIEMYATIPKKKCLVFKCNGGRAHDSAARALKANFNDEFEIIVVNIFEEVINSIDPVRLFTFKKYSGEDLFNFCIQNEFAWFANYIWDIGSWCIRKQHKRIENLFYDFMKKYAADCAISVIPAFNGAILSAAKNLNIPFLMVTLDLDTTYFFNGIEQPAYDKFLCTFIFDDIHLKNKITRVRLPDTYMKIVGFPLQPQFFEEKDEVIIKKDFNIPEEKPIILLIMGGMGSSANFYYVQEIAKITIPVHVVVCLGKNEKLRKKIEKIPLPAQVTITILGFTDRISDLMAIADILITKPGPTSLCEALQMNLPVFLHKTTQCAPWEFETYGFIERNHFGECITQIKKVNELLIDYLTHPEKLYTIRKTMNEYPKNNFFEAVRPLLHTLLGL